MNKIKAILFDFGGVISPIRFSFEKVLMEKGVDVYAFNRAFGELIGDHDSGKIDEKEFIKGCEKIFSISLPYEECRQKLEKNGLNYQLIDLIKKLKKNYKIGLLSNNNYAFMQAYLYETGLNMLFDAIVISYQEGIRKPDPKIYLLAAKRLEVKPEDILYIDDKERMLKPAKELGFQIMHFTDNEALESLKKLNYTARP